MNEEEPSMPELIKLARDLANQRLEIERKEEWAKNKIRIYLKERSIREFVDGDVTVRMDMLRRETLDKDKVKDLLSEKQWSQVIKITSYEKISIITPEVRKRAKQFINRTAVKI